LKLKRLQSGSFLIRLGHSEPGGYAVTRVREKNKVKEMMHMRIQYANEAFSLHQKKYDDLDDLVKDCEDKYSMKHPCLGSPYSSLFGEDGASKREDYYSDESDDNTKN